MLCGVSLFNSFRWALLVRGVAQNLHAKRFVVRSKFLLSSLNSRCGICRGELADRFACVLYVACHCESEDLLLAEDQKFFQEIMQFDPATV